MLTFFGESFGVFAKSITFASAFENERKLFQMRISSFSHDILSRMKRKSSLKRFT